jgi:hypothetical protein
MLNPASDTGASSTDGITSNNDPNFFGTATMGQTVTLYAQASGSSNVVAIGQTVATSAGTWSITATSPLADGSYTITATVTNGSASSTIQILPNATEGQLVIDTTGPTITNVTINPAAGQVTITYHDALTGLIPQELLNPAIYTVKGPRGRLSVAIATVPGGSNSTTSVVLTLNHGQALRRGGYVLSVNASGITDRAGKLLNGTFTLGFPTGSSTNSGNFAARFTAKGGVVSPLELPSDVINASRGYARYVRRHLRLTPG